MGLDLHLGIDMREGPACALDLGGADALGHMDDLALEVGEIDLVIIDDAERADARCSEIKQERRAEAAGADHQHPRLQQLLLAFFADLVQHQMPGVALELRLAQFHCTPALSLNWPIRRSEPVEQRSEEHTSELQSQFHLVCRLLLEK